MSLACFAIGVTQPHLDQLVRRERAVHLGDEGVGDAGVTYLNHWFEAVRPGLQVGAFV